ncbi:MAG: DUF3306 domain-containing protein [Burkholderiaceae bacterium]
MSADGFLGRWARRKSDVQQGKPVSEVLPPSPLVDASQGNSLPAAAAPVARAELVPQPELQSDTPPPIVEVPLPTLADVQQLALDSDFKPFMARGVTPEVKNAAMKKLFTDPHYNIMDGLDTYIEDYSVFEPLPESMLRQMASAKFLQLFEEEAEKPVSALPLLGTESPHSDAAQNVAKSSGAQNIAQPDLAATGATANGSAPQPDAAAQDLPTQDADKDPDDHHPDLRLQPDHAAAAPSPGRGTE